MNKFTPNQLRAITSDGSMIVSAGAGSGKTTVMISRIIEKLKKGASLGQMLIVTFTRASAADMRIKLSKRLSELAEIDEYKGIAQAALDQMPVCNIGTLHSYCQKLIKNYFFAADVDPSAAVCEEGESRLIKRAAVKSAVSGAVKNGDPYFAVMYDVLKNRRNDSGVLQTVEEILDYALSTVDPDGYLSDIPDDKIMFVELDAFISRRRRELEQKVEQIKKDLASAGMKKQFDAADDVMPYVDGLIDGVRKTLHKSTGDICDELNDEFKQIKTEAKKLREAREEAEQAKTVDSAPYVRALCAVAKSAAELFAERKAKLGKIDYSDLEHGAYRVLADPECMREISSAIKYVFIDEFQDVNPLQSDIARRFKDGGAEMFVVGDVKQSIYGFRRCSPEHFKRALNDPDYTKVTLADNFRSAPAVIDFINGVFDGVMTNDFGGVDYRNDERLVCGLKDGEEGEAAFYRIDECEADDEQESDSDGVVSVMRASSAKNEPDEEAAFVADRIVEWIGSAPEGEPRSLGSVAVLLRSTRGAFADELGAELAARGVRYNIGRKASVKDYPEVVAVVDMMRFADNKYDDVAMFTAARSAMGGFTDAELLEIAKEGEARARKIGLPASKDGKSYAFWQKAEAYDGRLKEKLNNLFELRNQIVKYAKSHDSADVLGYITSRTDYFRYVYETGGDATAVQAIIDCAAQRKCDMHAFLSFFDSADFEIETGGGGDAVTVTTIHSSKGLEYDFVIVADTSHKFNTRDNTGRVIIGERGVAVKLPHADGKTLVKSAPWLLANASAPDALRQEELRLFYVALTRAKKKLIVCGKNKHKSEVAPDGARCPLDFVKLLPAPVPEPFAVESATENDEPPVNDDIVTAVKLRFEVANRYEASALPIKTCVTALAAEIRDENADYTLGAPVLVSDGDRDEVSGADVRLRGTAYHKAMELVDFARPDWETVKAGCENYELTDEKELNRAVGSMKALTENAVHVFKERYFIADLPVRLIDSDIAKKAEKSESVLVQGVIDLLIIDKDGTVTIVDYKTGAPEHIKSDAGYKNQLAYYAEAVEKSTGLRVKHKYLYAFSSGELIEV